MKGIYEQMRENNASYIKDGMTIEDIQKYMEELFESRKQIDYRVQLPASDYEGMSDEDFKDLVTSPYYKFIGGSVGVNKMIERCKKLNIEY